MANEVDDYNTREFRPVRIASWWTTLEDLQWPQAYVQEKIKRRAAGFAKAGIDTAINFGFHIRFDFSNYFYQLHGYYAEVCNALHQHGIKFIDHYSCNHIERPKNDDELHKLNKFQRHHVLLYHDDTAAKYAQYSGHFYNEICQVDVQTGGLGYAPQYQLNTFCHSNPGFLQMHQKYLQRLLKDVKPDGLMVDDMCNYAGPSVCGCSYCRERFRQTYGHELPPFSDKTFWGDTSKEFIYWGNYENPVYRDWLRMKIDAISDHLKLIKDTIGNKPLMTCCSNTGPVILNDLSLDLERIAPHLDFFMLENVGTNIENIDWIKMDAEALMQKDIASKRNAAPAMALSYTIYEKGAYFGWTLSRFWGVANWSSTLNGRLEKDPADAMEMEDVINATNNWEIKNSDLDISTAKETVEVRLVYNRYCKANGWKDKNGQEHWDRVTAWTKHFLTHHIHYRFVRSDELEDTVALSNENTPLVLDGVACVSDPQFNSIKNYLQKNGQAWIALPFGTHDEKGFKREKPLSDLLIAKHYKNLLVVEDGIDSDSVDRLIASKKIIPLIKQISGDKRWCIRVRHYNGKSVFHFMNAALVAIPDPLIKDISDIPILKDLDSAVRDNQLVYEIDNALISSNRLVLMSPETGEEKRVIEIKKINNEKSLLQVNLDKIKLYAVVQ